MRFGIVLAGLAPVALAVAFVVTVPPDGGPPPAIATANARPEGPPPGGCDHLAEFRRIRVAVKNDGTSVDLKALCDLSRKAAACERCRERERFRQVEPAIRIAPYPPDIHGLPRIGRGEGPLRFPGDSTM